jgi:hypothetical protein
MKFSGYLIAGLMLSILACTNENGSKTDKSKAENPPNWGQRKTTGFDQLKTNFGNPDMIYAPFIFWFWDEPLNTGKMAEMSRVMGSEGFNPGYAHARQSMAGTPSLPDSQWLGDKWFSSFGAALTEAEKQNKYLGYCDEYWWPSFQAKGRVLKENPGLRAESLSYTYIDVIGGITVTVPPSFFAVAGQHAVHFDVSPPQPQPGKWIWSQDGQEIKHSCWFRKTFYIPAGASIIRSSLMVTADNAFVLYVNGKRTGEGSDWTKPAYFDLTGSVVAGENLLAVEGSNTDGPFGLLAGLLVTLDDGRTIKVLSDSTWTTSLTSVAGWEQPVCPGDSRRGRKSLAGYHRSRTLPACSHTQ